MATASPDAPTTPPAGDSPQALPHGKGVWPWVWAALLAAFFLYVRLRVNPALVYQAHWIQPGASGKVPVFRFSAPFLRDFLLRPGGLTESTAALLSQYHEFPWVGAAIISLLAAVLCLEAYLLLRAFGRVPPRLLHLVPLVPLLAAYGRYFDPLADALALALALACACLYAGLGWRGTPGRLAVFTALLFPLHYAAAGAALMYVLLCVLFEVTAGQRPVLGLLLLVPGIAVPYCMGEFFFCVSPAESLAELLPFRGLATASGLARASLIKRSLLEGALLAFYPLAALWAHAATPPGRRLRLVGAAVLAVLACGACAFHDGELKAEAAVDYYASRRMWPEVLVSARKVPFGTYGYLFTNCAVNRALFHMGQLGDKMFAYRQDRVGQMLCKDTLGSLMFADRGWVTSAELLADMGCVNEAEHLAFEAMQTCGDHPRLLELVALCSLAKGRTQAARILLGAASADPVQGRRARELLRRMDSDPTLSDDPQVRQMRACRVQKDVAGWQGVEEALKALLAQNPKNRMAFEYLMGRYLVYGRLDDFVAEVGRFDDMGYERIPRNYEEALLMYKAETRRALDLGGRSISAGTQARFDGFYRALAHNSGRPLSAQMDALSDYADTYMFYYCFLLPARRGQ